MRVHNLKIRNQKDMAEKRMKKSDEMVGREVLKRFPKCVIYFIIIFYILQNLLQN
jgi:hypothetical protein